MIVRGGESRPITRLEPIHHTLFSYKAGTGTVWFDDLKVEEVDIGTSPVKVTRDLLHPESINPYQYGQFVEYLCDLVPSMWAEKLY